jgi:hypothetical protein
MVLQRLSPLIGLKRLRLLLAILVAVIAYVDKRPNTLLCSVGLVAIGMIGIISSWVVSYYISGLLRNGFHKMINATADISRLIDKTRDYQCLLNLEKIKKHSKAEKTTETDKP